METERLKNSKLNISSNVAVYFIQIVLSFLVRTFFIKIFGEKLLGLDSLLVNLLAMLSIAELGVSTAISYGLYKPLAKKDINKINAYMSFYKRVYNTIGKIVIVVGIVVSFGLKLIIKDYNYLYLYLVYFIYLFDTASMYFISYKEILLIADQKNYKVFKYHFFFKVLLYLLQLMVLFTYPNYVFYLLMMVFSKLFDKIFVNRYIGKFYPYVDFQSNEKLSKNDVLTIKKNVFGLFCFKVGDYIINCTDNIIISSFINLVMVGIYTNYLSITTIVRSIIKNFFNGITASLGNLSVEGNKKAEREVFHVMVFLGFFIGGYVTICFLHLINPFIQIWLGKKYVLPYWSMVIICFNFYLMCNQMPLDTAKEAYGFYSKDKYIPILQAIINIVVSVVLANYIGFNGVILGTTISYLSVVFWVKPYMLYRYIFKDSLYRYYLNNIQYILVIVLVYFVNNYLLDFFSFSFNIFNLILSGIIISLVYFVIITVLYCRTNEYQFLFKTAKNILFRKK